jgi:DNA-binding MarR family transcriptional regulator
VDRLSRGIEQEAAATGQQLDRAARSALATIQRLGLVSIEDLASVQGVPPARAKAIVSHLVQLGYVSAFSRSSDGCIALIGTTTAGQELLRRQRTREAKVLARRIDDLGPDANALLARVMPLLDRIEHGLALGSSKYFE